MPLPFEVVDQLLVDVPHTEMPAPRDFDVRIGGQGHSWHPQWEVGAADKMLLGLVALDSSRMEVVEGTREDMDCS